MISLKKEKSMFTYQKIINNTDYVSIDTKEVYSDAFFLIINNIEIPQ